MENIDFKKLASQYEKELKENCMPFWLEKSQDTEYGGYFSCLNREGSVFDTDKFIWLQGREVWMFAMLYNNVEKNPEWLEAAVQGAEFLKKYGHDGNYDFYFSLTREGKPIIQPYNIFSNTFACMAFAQLAEASGNAEYADIAKKIFDRILIRKDNPKRRMGKVISRHPSDERICDSDDYLQHGFGDRKHHRGQIVAGQDYSGLSA